MDTSSAASSTQPQEQKKQGNVNSLKESLADTSVLDMVFVMDATGSMGSYIASAQSTIRSIVEAIVSAEKADVRFGLISYRDHPPQDSTYVTQVHDFTSSVSTMRSNLDKLSANGGGDGPEAVVDGLHDALKLDYRQNATKVCILIADAPPHGLGQSGDGFPNGCPCGLDPIKVCRQMAEAGIALHCIGCEPSISPYKEFFMAMSHITGGMYCPLGSASALSDVVVGGVREEMGLEKLVSEVQAELVSACADMDDEARTKHVWQKMKEKKVMTKQLKMGSSAMPQATPSAISMSKAADLSDVRKTFTPSHATYDSSMERGMVVDRSECLDSIECTSERLSTSPRRFAAKSAHAPSLLSRIAKSINPFARADASPSTEVADVDTAGSSERRAAPSMSAPMVAAATMSSSYKLEESEEISMEQCRRLVTKSVARSKY